MRVCAAYDRTEVFRAYFLPRDGGAASLFTTLNPSAHWPQVGGLHRWTHNAYFQTIDLQRVQLLRLGYMTQQGAGRKLGRVTGRSSNLNF